MGAAARDHHAVLIAGIQFHGDVPAEGRRRRPQVDDHVQDPTAEAGKSSLPHRGDLVVHASDRPDLHILRDVALLDIKFYADGGQFSFAKGPSEKAPAVPDPV